jgi:hypothetical protein
MQAMLGVCSRFSYWGVVAIAVSVLGLGCGTTTNSNSNTGSAGSDAAGATDAADATGTAGTTGTADSTGTAGATGTAGVTGAAGTGTAGTGADASAGGAGNAPTTWRITVDAAKNAVLMDACGVKPAVIADVPAGTYTIALMASTLSKGNVSVLDVPSMDNYVIVHAPLAAGDPHEDHRFFMLNGIGAMAPIVLSATGTIQAMFIDSDNSGDNMGTGTVILTPGAVSAKVDPNNNLFAYDDSCHSAPATLVLPVGKYRAALVDSTFSSGPGAHDDFVLLRIPSEQPTEDFRYVILNGVGASHDFSPYNSDTLLAWYIGASAGTGQATVMVSKL